VREGVVEFNGKFSSWKRSEHLSVPTENGVMPKFGDHMLKFSSMKVDVHSQTAETSEMLQVVDVRNLNLGVENINAQLQTSLYFNKGEGLVGDSTEFALSIHAISSDEITRILQSDTRNLILKVMSIHQRGKKFNRILFFQLEPNL
jgi:hypothetical protein